MDHSDTVQQRLVPPRADAQTLCQFAGLGDSSTATNCALDSSKQSRFGLPRLGKNDFTENVHMLNRCAIVVQGHSSKAIISDRQIFVVRIFSDIREFHDTTRMLRLFWRQVDRHTPVADASAESSETPANAELFVDGHAVFVPPEPQHGT